MASPWHALQGEVQQRDAVAAIAASPESVRHLAGVHFASQVMIRRRFAFVVVPAHGTPTLLVQAVLEGTARSQALIQDVATYVTGPVEGLAGQLKERRLDLQGLEPTVDRVRVHMARSLREHGVPRPVVGVISSVAGGH